jgi:serine protease Do
MSNKRQALIFAAGVLGIVLVSAISGGLAGSWAANRLQPSTQNQSVFRITNASATAFQTPETSVPSTTIRLVPLQMEDYAARIIPEAMFNRRSPVAALYLNRKSSVGENALTQDEQIGRAAAVTADGWFVTSAAVLDGLTMAEIVVWLDGKAYKPERILADAATQTVFIKTGAKDLPVTPFANVWTSRTGSAVWLELAAEQFMPSSILANRSVSTADPRSSEKSDKRLVVYGSMQKWERGAPVWDAKGAMVGILDSSVDDRLAVIPGSGISSSLQSLISGGQIQHASLGVLFIDRTAVRAVSPDANLPDHGAWLREEKKTGRAIVANSSAEKAGLKNDDVILQVDRDIMDDSTDLSDVILQYRPGASVTLRVWRSGKELDVPVTLGMQVTSRQIP